MQKTSHNNPEFPLSMHIQQYESATFSTQSSSNTCSDLPNHLVEDILSRHDYTGDKIDRHVSDKRRIWGIPTLYQTELQATKRLRAQLSQEALYRARATYDSEKVRALNEWSKKEYSSWVKILLDNIDAIFQIEPEAYLETQVSMMQDALKNSLTKKQKSNLQLALSIFQTRINTQKLTPPLETETTV